MKCPKCGADNPDSAEFCSLCMEKMAQPAGPSRSRMPAGSQGEAYTAPGEWQGGAEVLKPEVSRIVVEKMHKYRIKLAVFGVIVLGIVIWLILSFTVWGNPNPAERTMRLFDAANARDEAAFVDQFKEKDRDEASSMYARVASYLGDTGGFSDIKLDVSQENNYDASSYVESGSVRAGGGYERELSRSDNLIVLLENQKGVWYVIPMGTDIIP